MFSWDAEESFHASTMKVPVMMEVFHQVEPGRLPLNETLTIMNQFTSIQDGSIYTLKMKDDSDGWIDGQFGKSMTVRRLAERMINRSSNLATNLLLQRTSTNSIRELMTSIDASRMAVVRGLEDKEAFDAGRNNMTSARALGVSASKPFLILSFSTHLPSVNAAHSVFTILQH